MPTVIQSVQSFLRSQRDTHNGSDLLDRWLADGCALETQINVAADNGEPVDGRNNTYSDGVNTWHSIRIPKKANSVPEWNDYRLSWNLAEHVEAIGATGWDWQGLVSRWVGFDFDSITGHAAGVGISKEQLATVAEKAQALPYCEVRKSTGGSGLHIYVLLDAIPTANHTEHAALARCVLGMMSSEVNFDFASQIDACGGNLWIWHRKANAANQGFKLIKPATKTLGVADLPSNWRDHVEVVTRKRAKVRMPGVAEDLFTELVSSRRMVPLDDTHRKLMTQVAGVWMPDYHCFNTHTLDLAKVAGDYIGVFKTLSAGTTPVNCFCFPLENGAWRVYRFGAGVAEAETWTQDGDGWTTCYFNRLPDLRTAALAMGGIEQEGRGGFSFESAEKALEVVRMLGDRLTVDDRYKHRPATLRRNTDGRLIIDVKREDGDVLAGWAAGKKNWTRILSVQTEQPQENQTSTEHDAIVRSLKTPDGKDTGFRLRHEDGEWVEQNKGNCQAALMSLGNSKDASTKILGGAIFSAWKLVNLPFQTEYPGDRQWNLNSAQLKVKPVEGEHPHWDLILNHCGQSLDESLRALDWARKANILTGRQYLQAWIAACIRHTFEPTPYLFFHGPENSGKSSFWEALLLLMSNAVVSVDRYLGTPTDFNSELESAIICVTEERNLAKTPSAIEKIKNGVTNPTVSIRRMHTNPYTVPNKTHWVQCSNDSDACPVFPGDSRIVVADVPEFTGPEIPKVELMKRLQAEAPAFLYTLLNITLPERIGRLRIPVVETESKKQQSEDSCPVVRFVADCCEFDPMSAVIKSDVYRAYREWVTAASESSAMTSDDFYKSMRRAYRRLKTGRATNGAVRPRTYLGMRLVQADPGHHAISI